MNSPNSNHNTRRNAPRQFGNLLLLCFACAFVVPVSAAAPDERDRQVLETLMLLLLADSKFAVRPVYTKEANIVLHSRTPEKTGLLLTHQVRSEIGSRTLPAASEYIDKPGSFLPWSS